MSDGPHRSLPMRLGWKKVAACGDNRAFAPEEVSECVVPALEADCREEISPTFLDSFNALYDTLFRVNPESELESLSDLAGSGLERRVLENAKRLAAQGETGPDAPVKAVTNTLMDHAARCSKQVEEHWLRESTERRARECAAAWTMESGRQRRLSKGWPASYSIAMRAFRRPARRNSED